MAEKNSVFNELNAVDVKDKIREKNGLKYISWASAWAEVKKRYPGATFKVYKQIVDDGGNTRPWHDDTRTGWVEVGVTIDGNEIIETLAIMDYKNQSIPADQITSVNANKSLKRCLVKAIAMHGLGLYIYEGEDLPEETGKVIELQNDIMSIIKKKAALSDGAKEKVGVLCKNAEKEANPHFEESEITGNPKNIDDIDILEKLKRQLLGIRK